MLRSLQMFKAMLFISLCSHIECRRFGGLHHNRCGIRSNMLQKRIVNGASAVPHSWPWMAILETLNTTSGKFRHHCGGSLVQRQFIVTAAHCMVFAPSRNLSHFRIRLGDHDRSVSEPSEQVFKVVRSIVHPLYDNHANNDVAVLKLDRPATLSDQVGRVCLPRQGQDVLSWAFCYITGWGRLATEAARATILQEARLPIVDNKPCEAVSRFYNITDKMMCAGFGPNSTVSGCVGDSGGPFVCQNWFTGRWVLQGSTTGGTSACGKTFSVFARTSEFSDWITSTMLSNQNRPLLPMRKPW